MKAEMKEPLTIREKIVIRLVIFLIQMIKPFDYEHEFTAFFKDILSLMWLEKNGK